MTPRRSTATGQRPRPIGRVIQSVLPGLLPEPAELVELTAPERRRLYDLAHLDPLRRAEIEEAIRQAMRRRYRRAT
jgi:hypothetical protein